MVKVVAGGEVAARLAAAKTDSVSGKKHITSKVLDPSESSEPTVYLPKKPVVRTCGHCKQVGHNKRTCVLLKQKTKMETEQRERDAEIARKRAEDEREDAAWAADAQYRRQREEQLNAYYGCDGATRREMEHLKEYYDN